MILFAFLVQIGGMVIGLTWFARYSGWAIGLHFGLGLAAILYLVNSKVPAVYQLTWAIPILLLPIVGAAFYLLYGAPIQRTRERLLAITAGERRILAITAGPTPATSDLDGDPIARRQATYLEVTSGYEAYDQTATTYYSLGDDAWPAMLADLEAAKNSIFVEYFIVAEGTMLDELMEVLERKAASGVRVFFVYDDLGSVFRLPVRFAKDARAAGLRVHASNPVGLGLTLRYNNRNHRKLMVIDGQIAYTGGINIADEYVNRKHPYGHWKDTVIRLEGPGAWPFVAMSLAVWGIVASEHLDPEEFRPAGEVGVRDAPGVVVPFDDVPFDDEAVGANAYRHLLSQARRTVDIFTPYLVTDEETMNVMIATARSGVRVRIVCPGTNDSTVVAAVARSYYEDLIRAGVEIYEYEPGFMHAKSVVADDEYAVIGTINFDYRSLYLNQENAVWMWKTSCISDMSTDFTATLEKCRSITLAECEAVGLRTRLFRSVLKVLAPLL